MTRRIHPSPRLEWEANRCIDGRVSRLCLGFAVLGLHSTLALVAGCGEPAVAAKPAVTAAQLGDPEDEIDPKVIGAAVRGNSREFQLCYESARERNPSLAGQVDVRFVVQRDGSIGPSAVAESSLPKEVSDCIARTFLRLTLPKQERAVVAQYPMFLDPN